MPNPIRVLLVDDHAIARNGVRLMLSAADDIRVDGEASNAQEAVRLVAAQDFDVALLDITMPGKNGLDLLKTLRADKPKLAVLMLSTYSEEIYAVRALKLGAAGYLTKDAPTDTLVAAVRKAAAAPAIDKQIEDIRQLAVALKIQGTPVFVIGDALIPGADMEAVRAAITQAKAGDIKPAAVAEGA